MPLKALFLVNKDISKGVKKQSLLVLCHESLH